ncbi:histidinol dehydrogenase [Desulfosoma caldarium]|uniref:Histidinol dehydrogenase n=1 Tax=Desulfosoma caldarium TaxID=610254 RepID=A0A3N1UY60_9BACT|nr:histidinol dehydrogenase [Desulfosoma caldarium]ROQ92206.1 histidinol dehydrogenase [Desulfosoma caldarium]
MVPVLSYPSAEAERFFSVVTGRQVAVDPEVEKGVQEILEAVRREGDDALVRFTRRFDAPDFSSHQMTVPPEEIDRAYAVADPSLVDVIRRARDNIFAFHEHQKQSSWFITRSNGCYMGQLVQPVAAAGLYVPGGQGGETPLVSTVLMTAVPAVVAGVSDIAMVSPPRRDGSLNPYLLVAAREAGVHRIHPIGSAWAVAALAFGTQSVRAVDVLVGPGNIYVSVAKKLVAGRVGLDGLAGPSEVVVVADHSADPNFVAADLLSQAEHDPMASAVCITDDTHMAEKVLAALETQTAELARQDIARRALARYGAIVQTSTLEEAMVVANRLAPEHLELLVEDPWALLPSVRHAGAVFMGAHTPEALGDYFAGPNHVLPTSGTARFASALSVETFLKKTTLLAYSEKAFERDAAAVMALASLERLDAHARSVQVRMASRSHGRV